MTAVNFPRHLRGLTHLWVCKQPDRITCGPACLKMVSQQLEFHMGLDIKTIGKRMGTNSRTGTTEVEMQKGLECLGLTFQHPVIDHDPLCHLRETLESGHTILLRTLLPGGRLYPEGFKHWVVVYGENTSGFLVACPGRGRVVWNADYLEQVWAARGYDHFTVPTDRRLHPKMIEKETNDAIARWKPIHEMSLREFLQGGYMIPNDKLTSWHHQMIREAADKIMDMNGRIDGWRMAYDAVPGFLFTGYPRNGATSDMAVSVSDTGEIVGGISKGVRWVKPSYRGIGLGAEIILAAYSEPGKVYLQPSSYSEAGYASRLSAYKTAIARAVKAGWTIPEHANFVIEDVIKTDSQATPTQLSLF